MAATAPAKLRDADRSREAILAAAERLFAEHGYDGASLGEIAAAAGLSRGAPSYFFGSKRQLYGEVIERSFATREQETRTAFEPVRDWADGDAGLDELRRALTSAARDYMAFLAKHRSFVRLVMLEELSGGRSILSRRGTATAMRDAFEALRATGPKRGLDAFSVDDAVPLFIALTFAPVSYSNTWRRAAGWDLRKPAGRERQVELAVDQVMHLLTG